MQHPGGITKQTFLEASEQSKWAMTYDLLYEIRNDIKNSQSCNKQQRVECEARFQKIEKYWARLAGALLVVASLPTVILVILKVVEI